MISEIEAARRRYKPDRVSVVLIAESPPKAEPPRFFYFENVTERDSLFLETMKVLYPALFASVDRVRAQKKAFLERFKRDGFYLIDAVESPIGKASRTTKRRRVRESLPSLLEKLKSELVSRRDVPLVLISASVFHVCNLNLRDEGFNVLNTELIDFPTSGRQRLFRTKLREVLAAHSLPPSGL